MELQRRKRRNQKAGFEGKEEIPPHGELGTSGAGARAEKSQILTFLHLCLLVGRATPFEPVALRPAHFFGIILNNPDSLSPVLVFGVMLSPKQPSNCACFSYAYRLDICSYSAVQYVASPIPYWQQSGNIL